MQVNSKGTSPTSDYDELIVEGDVTGGTVNLNNGGDASVGGDVSNSVFELNAGGGNPSGTLRAGGAITAVANQGTKIPGLAGEPAFEARFPEDVGSALMNTSSSLTSLSGVGPTVSGNRATFNAAPTNGTTVYSFDFSLFDSISEIDLALNGANTVIMNVSGLGGTLADNFLGGPFDAAPHTLWNFSEAETLDFTRQFFGSVLAPNATATHTTSIEGTLAVMAATLRGEVHLQPYQGDLPQPIPLPAGLPLMAAGVGALALMRRLRRGA